ncbi:MAG: hypothetical protein MZV70_55690 [Desulfobacterales bacterium]|nr:hypothetical protein [Desulfobacterales bacterium]
MNNLPGMAAGGVRSVGGQDVNKEVRHGALQGGRDIHKPADQVGRPADRLRRLSEHVRSLKLARPHAWWHEGPRDPMRAARSRHNDIEAALVQHALAHNRCPAGVYPGIGSARVRDHGIRWGDRNRRCAGGVLQSTEAASAAAGAGP